MPKRTMFTNITPLPPEISREVAVAMLHDHDEMIELNPLVIEHHPIKTPRDAPADEFLDCVWQELTDKIHYLPGGMVKGKVSYRACFHDLPRGLQTHIYAPMGLDIREKWSIGGSLPGEAPEARELGLDAPTSGLYLREDGDMRCPRFLTSFVHKNLNNAHKVLVERILKKAQRIERHREAMATAQRSGLSAPNLMDHPAFRQSYQPPSLHPQHNRSWSLYTSSSTPLISDYPQPVNAYPQPNASLPATKQFLVELPGSLDSDGGSTSGKSDRSPPANAAGAGSDRSDSHGQHVPIGYVYNPQDFQPYADDLAKRANYTVYHPS
ncbi:hypothetical protein DV737_g1800, partial [Chaetothyriales sp. CBS 132003]